MNIVYISFMVPFLLLILDLTQIVSTVRTLRAGIFDLVKFPVSKIILHYSLLSRYYIWETYSLSLNIDNNFYEMNIEWCLRRTGIQKWNMLYKVSQCYLLYLLILAVISISDIWDWHIRLIFCLFFSNECTEKGKICYLD